MIVTLNSFLSYTIMIVLSFSNFASVNGEVFTDYGDAGTLCPVNCTCEPDYDGEYEVYCRGDFTSFPSYFPPPTIEINFDTNRLTVLMKENFTDVRGLYALYARHNEIFYVSSDAFYELTQLLTVDLSKNPLTATSFRNILCGLYIDPGYTTITLDAVYESREAELSRTQLACLAGKEIYSLSLAHNFFKPFDPGLFSGLKISSLNLDNTSSSSVFDTAALDGIQNLVTLSISQNGLRTFPNFTLFKNAAYPNISSLEANGNRFGSLMISDMRGLDSLEYLALDDNKVPSTNFYIEDGVVDSLKNLKSFSFTGNSIYLEDEGQINMFHSETMTYLDVSELSLTKLHREERLLPTVQTIFSSVKQLRYLRATRFNFQWFLGRGRRTFWGSVFQNISTLTSLDLSDNPEFLLIPHMFRGLNELGTLNLGGCEIRYVVKDLFSSLPYLQRLHLGRNRITVIDRNSFPGYGAYLLQLSKVDVSENPFNCSCDLRWFTNFTKAHSERFLNIDQTLCLSPGHLPGLRVVDFKPDFKICVLEPFALGYIVALGAASFILISLIMTAFIHKYRWHLKDVIFNIRSWLGRLEHFSQEEKLAYKYDAFVSYHNNSLKWIKTHLIPNIERKWGLKLCLHDRDWLAGGDIIENIVDSIEKSRKVLLIIDNAFARSQWCQLELTLAQHRLFENDRDNLILILLEDIYNVNMTPRLSLQLKASGLVHWSENIKGQKLFFGQLKIFLEKPSISPRFEPV